MMIKNIMLLTKISTRNFLQNLNILDKNTKKINKKSMYVWMLIVIIIAIAFVSNEVLNILEDYGQMQIFLNVLFTIAIIIMFMQTIIASMNILYFSKDIEYFLPMPIKAKELLLSKVNTMINILYGTELLFMLIPLILYGVSTTASFSYYVYVIANDPGVAIVVNDVIDEEAIENMTATSMSTTYAKADNFIMFNECNAQDKKAGVSITIDPDDTYDRPATCDPIYLDRLAVKITSSAPNVTTIGTKDKPSELPAIKKVQLVGFKLVNGVTKTYLQQHWERTLANAGSYPWFNNLQIPTLSNNATDFYNHLSAFRTLTSEDGVYTAVVDEYDKVSYYNASDLDADIYCMENKPANDLYGTTTGLIYQWQATEVEGSDGNAGTNCFYSYGGNFYVSLAAIEQENPGAFDAATITDIETTKLAAAEKELKDACAKTGDEKQSAISAFRVKYRIKVFTDGIMYYSYFIKDQNYVDSNTDKTSHYYAVMRNTVYGLTVTALERIGTDIPGGWDPDREPEDPLDPTNVYMQIQVRANPWVVSNQDITLD